MRCVSTIESISTIFSKFTSTFARAHLDWGWFLHGFLWWITYFPRHCFGGSGSTTYSHFLGLRHPFGALIVANVFIEEIVWLHRFLSSIVSNRGRIFLSTFWKELFRLQGNTQKCSTSYHLQTDGLMENVNWSLEIYPRCFVAGNPKSWAKWVPWVLFSHNTSPHMSTKLTPYKVVYGRDLPTFGSFG